MSRNIKVAAGLLVLVYVYARSRSNKAPSAPTRPLAYALFTQSPSASGKTLSPDEAIAVMTTTAQRIYNSYPDRLRLITSQNMAELARATLATLFPDTKWPSALANWQNFIEQNPDAGRQLLTAKSVAEHVYGYSSWRKRQEGE